MSSKEKAIKLIKEVANEVTRSGGSTSFPVGDVENKLDQALRLLKE